VITFCCIFQDSDGHFLQGMLESLPSGSQVILMRTQSGFFTESHFIDKMTENGLEIIRVDYFYKEWSFADARNECQKFAERGWIYFIDADERVSFDKERDYALIKRLDEKIGGLLVNISSAAITKANNIDIATTKMIRMYRNNKGFYWQYGCHEQIAPSIQEKGFIIGITDFMIRHLGYIQEIDIIQKKYERNIELMAKDIGNKNISENDRIEYYEQLKNSITDYLNNYNAIENAKKVKHDNAA